MPETSYRERIRSRCALGFQKVVGKVEGTQNYASRVLGFFDQIARLATQLQPRD
jgi:hypothetical protein